MFWAKRALATRAGKGTYNPRNNPHVTTCCYLSFLISPHAHPQLPLPSPTREGELAQLFTEKRREWEARAKATPVGAREGKGVGVVDTFCGQGALLLALAMEGVKVARFFGCDNDPKCGLMLMCVAEYCMEMYPECVTWGAVAHMFAIWGDASRLTAHDLAALGHIHVSGAGPPCQPFSRADPRSKGFGDPRAKLFIEATWIKDTLQRLSEGRGETLWFLIENVEPAPWLRGCRETMDSLASARGVLWCGGLVAPSARPRIWWTNGELRYAPPSCRSGPSLAEVLRDCGGVHHPRLATSANEYNVRGAPVRVTATVMASAKTKSLLPPPGGTGTGLHVNTVTGALEPLWPHERFAVMAWPPIIALRMSTQGLRDAEICHGIGNSMNLAAVRYWVRHLPAALRTAASMTRGRQEGDADEADGRDERHLKLDSGEDGPARGEEGLGGESAEEQARHARPETKEAVGAHGDNRTEAIELRLPSAEHAEDAAEDWCGGDPHEAPLPEGEMHGFHLPEESDFIEGGAESATQGGGAHLAQLEAAAREYAATAFDAVPEEGALREAVRIIMREIRAECARPSHERDEPPMDEVAAAILATRAECLNPEKFQAGRYQLHYAAWDEMCLELHRMGLQDKPHSSHQKRVLKTLKEGARPSFWDIDRGFTEGHKAFKRRHKDMLAEIAKMDGVSEQEASRVLQGDTPPRRHFRNRPSMLAHFDWVVEAVKDMLRCGAARIWGKLPERVTRGEAPWIVSPLSVAIREKDGKKRLCIDIRFFNLWLRYLSVRFDSVKDLAAMVDRMRQEGATEVVVCCSDMKSGYFHVPLAEDCWKFFAFEVGGVVMCYTVLNFGFAQSPRIYCAVEGMKHAAFTALGVQLAEYIDDSARPYVDRAASLAIERRLLRLGTLLGGYYSFGDMQRGPRGEVFYAKMQLWPQRWVEFLGFMLDLEKRTISIPESKLAYLERRLGEWLAQGDLSSRDLARFAGLLISIQPAIPFSKGLARDALRALVGAEDWDAVMPPPEGVKRIMEWLLGHMRAWNGTHWYAYPAGIRVMGDYSPNGTGGVIARVGLSDGEGSLAWQSAPFDLPIEVVASFSPEDFDAIKEGRMSSARGELVAADHLIDVALAEAPPELIGGRTLVYVTDGQAAVNALNRIYSPVAEMHTLVMGMHAKVLSRGGRLVASWVPREENQDADRLSKVPDPSAWELNWNTTKKVWRELLQGTAYQAPTLDAFADLGNKKAAMFISRWPSPGACAVDAMVQGALMGGVHAPTGRRHLVHMNPPWGMWPEVVRLIRRWRINCVLIYPIFRGAGFAEIERLPLTAGPIDLPRRRHLFVAGPRVPATDLGRARFRARAALVIWDD